MILNETHKLALIQEIRKYWIFRNEPLLHDIPLPVVETKSGIKSIEIPKEHLNTIDFLNLDKIIKSEKSKFYLINEDNEAFFTNHISSDYLVNTTVIDSNFEWIMCISTVFNGIGQTVVFGGENFVKMVHILLKDKEQWLSEI